MSHVHLQVLAKLPSVERMAAAKDLQKFLNKSHQHAYRLVSCVVPSDIAKQAVAFHGSVLMYWRVCIAMSCRCAGFCPHVEDMLWSSSLKSRLMAWQVAPQLTISCQLKRSSCYPVCAAIAQIYPAKCTSLLSETRFV